jgi:hypothetical protein
MIDSYTTDIIRIITSTYDNDDVETQSESGDIKARVEDTNELIKDVDGKETKGNMSIWLSQRDVSYLDKVKVKTKLGQTFSQPDKEFIIKKITNLNMFETQYLELII